MFNDGFGTAVLIKTSTRRSRAQSMLVALFVFLLAMPSIDAKADAVRLPADGVSSRVDAIRSRGSLRVAVLDEYPWLKQTNAQPVKFEGPAWLLAEEFADRLGVKLETVRVNFDNKVSILAGDQVDITIAPLLVTAERARAVDMVPYSISAQCLFGLANNPKLAHVANIDQLNRSNITVAYIDGSPQGEWLRKRLWLAAQHRVPGNLADVPIGEILNHRADVASIDKFFFAGFAKKVPGLLSVPNGDACLNSQELPIPIGMAIAKGQPAFLEWMRAVAQATKSEVGKAELKVTKLGS